MQLQQLRLKMGLQKFLVAAEGLDRVQACACSGSVESLVHVAIVAADGGL